MEKLFTIQLTIVFTIFAHASALQPLDNEPLVKWVAFGQTSVPVCYIAYPRHSGSINNPEAPALETVRLLEIGDFHGDEVSAKSGEVWYGMFPVGSDFMVKRVSIGVETVFDAIVDEEGERTGKRITVPGKLKPLFLTDRDLRSNRKQKILTLHAGETAIHGAFAEEYLLGGRTYNLTLANLPGNEQSGANRQGLVLSSGPTVQRLAESVEAESELNWRILWVGDLDSDGRLDLYADLSDHYNVSDRMLFLSSVTEEGDLVAVAGRFRTVGC